MKRALLTTIPLLALALSPRALAQSSFDTDPFASRFRERANLDLKFKTPEEGGTLRVVVPEGDPPGRQTLVGESVWEAEAPPGKSVLVEYQNIRLTAHRVRGDYTKRTVVAEGDVVLEQAGSRLTGARLDLDLDQQVGVLTDGTVDLEGGLHVQAATIAKVGPRSFNLIDGVVTSCGPNDPAWYFRLRSGRVTLEDYARLKNVVFRLGGVPLLYTPYLVWPALQDRASGFLVPGTGYNSRRGGYLGLSYYWAIARSVDATFSSDLYTKSFFGFGAEVRARPSEGTKGEGTYYIVWDPEVSRWRWETRGNLMADDLAPGLRGVLSWLDVSDQAFFQDYSRDFNLTSTRSVKSEAFLTYGTGPLSLNLRLGREEALFGVSTMLSERLPVLEARMRPTPLFGQGFFVSAEGQAGMLRVDRGPGQPSGRYARFDFFPKVSAPLSLVPWLSVQGEVGGRLTSYGSQLGSDGTSLVGESFHREYLTTHVEVVGPSAARIFDFGLGDFQKVKHILEPRFDYNYVTIPDPDNKTPLFDEVDSVADAHTLRYALVQRLLGKPEKGAAREIASLEIGRTYSFRLPGEGTVLGPTPTVTRNGPWDAALRVSASSNLNLDARTTYDSSASQITSASLTANVTKKDLNVNVSLFDSRPVGVPASAQLRVMGGTPIIPKRLRFDLAANYDLSEGRMLESRALLTLEGSCFKILTEYRDLRIGDVPARDFRIALNLKNIGSFLDFTGSLAR